MHAVEHPSDAALTRLPLDPYSWLSYTPAWLEPARADALLDELTRTLDWQRGAIRLFGRRVAIPRLHAWYGDPGASYGWSGQRQQPLPWTPALAATRERLRCALAHDFNGALANLYRDGQDCMHWHADDEPELGPAPLIAALSLGAPRRFALRHKARQRPTQRLQLGHGSLLVMGGACQRDWQHALPRSRRVTAPRISLTFRQLALTED